jgi:Na+-transporting NADH:ubiquinone oxidoreductase subunit NqrB
MYPALLAATAAELASAAAQLAAPAAAGKRIFAAARKLWFLPATSPDQVTLNPQTLNAKS